MKMNADSRNGYYGFLFVSVIAFGLGVTTALVYGRITSPKASAAPAEQAKQLKGGFGFKGEGAIKARPTQSGDPESDVKRRLRLLQEKKDRGEYVLDYEDSSERERNVALAKRAGAHNIKLREAEYTDLFAALGVDQKTAEQLKNHLELIYRAKMEASIALGQLVSAQNDYDNRVRKELGDKYELYRNNELATKARREMEQLRQFASQRQVSLVDSERSIMESLIQSSAAYSSATLSEWGGAYDDLPSVAGGQRLISAMEQRGVNLQRQANEVIQNARTQGLSQNSISILEDYYTSKIAATADELARARDPALGLRNRLSAELESLRRSANPDAAAISRIERVLAAISSSKR